MSTKDMAKMIAEIAEGKVFKGDDGYSEVPDVELDDELPETDLEKKYKNAPGLSADEYNKKMKSQVKESSEDDDEDEEEDLEDNDEVNEMFESIFGESYDELDSLVESILSEDGEAKRRGPPARTEAEKRLAKEIAKRVALVHYYDKGKKVGTNYRASNKTNPETLRKEVEVMKMQLAKLRAQRIKGSNSKTKQRADQWGVTKEDINVSDDLNAIFGNESGLSEEFKDKVKTIYEASVLTASNAVINRVVSDLKESYEEHAEELEAQIREEYEEKVETIAELADNYLDKAITEWKEENKIAIEESIRTKLNESFMHKLRNLFLEHNIDVPETEVNLVEEMGKEIKELKEMLNSSYKRNQSIEEELVEVKKNILVESYSGGLTENEKEKFKLLSENIDFDDDYEDTLVEIKNAYFNKSKKKVEMLNEEFDPVHLEETKRKSNDDAVNSIIKATERLYRK
jgi:hypothetical protein